MLQLTLAVASQTVSTGFLVSPKFKKYLLKSSNLFVQVIIIYLLKLKKHICPNWGLYLFKLRNVFVQTEKYVSVEKKPIANGYSGIFSVFLPRELM